MEKSAEAFRTISEAAEELDLPQHVLRFWETRFTQIKPLKRGGGRRYYRPEDVELLRAIRQLLYGEGYTIKGVQKILKEQGVRSVAAAFRAASTAGGERMSLIFGPASADGGEGGTGLQSRVEDAMRPPAARDAAYAPEHHQAESRDFKSEDFTMEDRADFGGSGNGPAAGLYEGDLRKLEALLSELAECERILLAARRS